jgi:replication-associated recombination protein RarA
MATNTLFTAESQQDALFAMESQRSLEYPRSLTEEFRPLKISDFVGLPKVKTVLSNLVRAPRNCSLLFSGSPGTGKSSMALAFSSELNADLWHLGSADCRIDKLQETINRCHYIPRAGLKGFHVILADEIETASPASINFLLSKMDATEPIPNTILIFTCNDSSTLSERFVSRALKLDFNSYGASGEILSLLETVWEKKSGGRPQPKNLHKLAVGNVRESLNRLEVALLEC